MEWLHPFFSLGLVSAPYATRFSAAATCLEAELGGAMHRLSLDVVPAHCVARYSTAAT